MCSCLQRTPGNCLYCCENKGCELSAKCNYIQSNQFTMETLSTIHFIADIAWRYLSCIVTKPIKWLCAQRRLRSAWASTQSVQSLRCAFNGYLRILAFFKRTAKALIRLGGCGSFTSTSTTMRVRFRCKKQNLEEITFLWIWMENTC